MTTHYYNGVKTKTIKTVEVVGGIATGKMLPMQVPVSICGGFHKQYYPSYANNKSSMDYYCTSDVMKVTCKSCLKSIKKEVV